MKRLIRNLLNITMLCSLGMIISCSNDTEEPNITNETPIVVNQEEGIATVRMFVPDYYALAEQGTNRAIAPQTTTARLSYNVNGSWVGINSINLSDATKTAVENAPDGFSGSVYTCTFSGVPVGTYNAGNLQIELMDASGNAITSGTNTTSATIVKGGSASTTFYTIPVSTDANTGNLKAGEMRFSRAALVSGVDYPIAITSSGDYPDLVLFSSDGKLSKYYAIDSETAASITLAVDTTDVYYLGLWADDGKDIARYTLSFDFGSGTQVSGVLTGDSLTWTKAKSPYIVNGNLLVREGSELTIEPGVIVQFTGDYYLKVNGVISAIGSKTAPIIFVQSGDNLGSWSGISIDSTTSLNITDNYTYASGNILKNCMVIGANTPLTLNSAAYVDSCTFTGNSDCVNVNGSNSVIINNVLDSGISVNGYYTKVVNNKISSQMEFEWSSNRSIVKNNTITNASVKLYPYSNDGNIFIFSSNVLNSCSISVSTNIGEDAQINGNNFVGYNGIILDASMCSYATRKYFNFTGNYWGESQTAELNELGDDTDISFFNDYYDNFEWTEIDYSNWATSPIEGAGYLGDGFIAFDYTINGYNYDNGGYYPESTSPELSIAIAPQYHANSIASVRIAQSLSALKQTAWSSYSASKNFTVDKNSLTNDIATIYVQLKDSKGNLSSPVIHEVPFDNPVVTLSIADGTTYSSATSSVSLNFSATDKGNLTQYALYLDGVKVKSEESSSGWGKSITGWSYSLGLAYMSAGTHSLKLTFWDSARNSTTKEIYFTINRTVDTSVYAGTSFDTTSGQLLKDTNTVYLWHLDSNGSEASGDGSAFVSTENDDTGGLSGYARYAYTSGSVSLPLENSYTVEFWRKGSNDFRIEKSSVFEIYSTYGYYQYASASGSVTSEYFDWPLPSDDNWHFWSYVFESSYTAVYCDSILVWFKPAISQTTASNDNKLYVDCRNIDELRISRTARSADEIAAYYTVAKDLIQ
ncbi:hypothetical protein [uncultured Treponema sp.]|uniref:hypothetical protein n=1 Tax=uncultured Treponema sp. TaxID=162155 RepID=UPI0025DE3D3F|nr:hypothetical protein [uncultured Treponema sp.]